MRVREQPEGLPAVIGTDRRSALPREQTSERGDIPQLAQFTPLLLFEVSPRTAGSFSYHTVAGLQPGMCHVPVTPSHFVYLVLIIPRMTKVTQLCLFSKKNK